ncbi:MAG: VOC family protein [Alphaproteobacteria bacterium]|nr:VOC family protein [Alphaproteobacteria bacterium]
MKRLHIHVAVDDLEKSIGFYCTLFGAKPIKQKTDYAKWLLDDPRVNFAISSRGAKSGLDHLGIQVDTPEELEDLRENMKRADLGVFDEGETTCCYAKSDKSWLKDPSGIAWEAYHTMSDVEFFNEAPAKEGTTCCAPKVEAKPIAASCAPKSGCC